LHHKFVVQVYLSNSLCQPSRARLDGLRLLFPQQLIKPVLFFKQDDMQMQNSVLWRFSILLGEL